MRLTFWGAARTVTGSQHLVETASGHRLLLDCGLYQGRRSEANRINRTFGFDAASLDAVLLSHAHIDHAGLLPKLYREGFRGRIYATHATRDLCALMLRDSAYIQGKDAEFYNRKLRKRGQPQVEPLYEMEDAEDVMNLFVGVGYRQSFSPLAHIGEGGVSVEYRDAGHILGSASMVLSVTEDGTTKRVGFTGDLGMPDRPILRDPQPMADCDVLIAESTYGGRTHEPADQAKDRLREIISATAARGGKVIIPAFAVGRTQTLVYYLDQLATEGALPDLPVFVDSPLAVNVTGVFQSHPECYDRELLDYMLADPNPFGFKRLEYVREAERSKQLNQMSMPFVVISASGMAEAGRILHHLRNHIENPKNTVLIVGYQAEHTLGRRIVEQRREVKIFGQPHQLRAGVEVLNFFSAHADEPTLVDFVGTQDRDRLQRIFLVHGDLERQQAMAHALNEDGWDDVVIPERGESFDV